jgi:hypothetical protein
MCMHPHSSSFDRIILFDASIKHHEAGGTISALPSYYGHLDKAAWLK